MGGKKIADRILVELPRRKTFFETPWHIWRIILKMNFKMLDGVWWTDKL